MRVAPTAALLILLNARPTACSSPYSFSAHFDMNMRMNLNATLQLSELKGSLAPLIPVPPSALSIGMLGLCGASGGARPLHDGDPACRAGDPPGCAEVPRLSVAL